MRNYKIRVNSKSESKEAQQLFFELGYNWFKKGYVEVKTPETIMSFENGALSTGIRGSINHKEITLPQLRDLVVLKRNSIDDATHTDPNEKESLYFRLFGEWWNLFTGGKWQQFCHMYSPRADKLKPIEKPMKEYLRKNSNGTYSYIGTVRPEHVSDSMIEIPEGATYYAKDASLGKSGNFFFRLRSDDFDFEAVWLDSNWIQAIFNVENQDVLWQRNNNQTIASAVESSLPEELPFIDDECYTNKSDGVFSLPKSEPCDISNWVEIREEGSLNDQYAEIEGVRQTLKTRQEQYGSFEDVAMITEQMVDVMRKGYYEKLSYNQKMALYMICSKIARIVNGNPNHKDSWHDIAGYATLIDNELVSEKDMPF